MRHGLCRTNWPIIIAIRPRYTILVRIFIFFPPYFNGREETFFQWIYRIFFLPLKTNKSIHTIRSQQMALKKTCAYTFVFVFISHKHMREWLTQWLCNVACKARLSIKLGEQIKTVGKQVQHSKRMRIPYTVYVQFRWVCDVRWCNRYS